MSPERAPLNVLFLCTGNSARSIMAEAILNHLCQGRFRAFSAGSHPRGSVDPAALDTLRSWGIDTAGLRSKSWEEFAAPDAPAIDIVLTVCDNAARETCPLWPGKPARAHWGVEDPASFVGPQAQRRKRFVDVAHQLRSRIERLVALPPSSFDASSIQDALGPSDNPDAPRGTHG